MHNANEKMSNMKSAAKEKAKVYKAMVEEKAEKATARSKDEKELAHEKRKMKEAEAKMELHAAKAELHKAEKLDANQHAHHTTTTAGSSLLGTHGTTGAHATHGVHHHEHGTTAGGVMPTTGLGVPTNLITGRPHPPNKYI